jgi:trk system potassium uptake protein
MTIFKKISPARFIVIGFAIIIALGTIILMLPVSSKEGTEVSFVNALFTSTSAVCVTGLVVTDTADTFTVFGQTVIATLIQIGGLGVSSVGVGIILMTGKRVTFKERIMVKEALNLDSVKGIVRLLRAILLMTLCFEAVGAGLSFIVFSKDFPLPKAIGISLFHSVAAFNNSGFDIMGGFQNLVPYRDNILMNFTTCGLVIFGGLGFYVIKEVINKRSFKKLSLHSKVVIAMTILLLTLGTLILRLTENMNWMAAFFHSTSARTAGFNTYPISDLKSAGLFTLMILMFIGASPGSTGGGIKTTTAFTLIKSAYSMSTNRHCMAFKRKIPNEIITKAFIISFLSIALVCFDTLLISIIEPEFSFMHIMFEVVSAFGTVGLSAGITTRLSEVSKLIIIVTMFIGRLGPLTMASIWIHKPSSNIRYSEENITIG